MRSDHIRSHNNTSDQIRSDQIRLAPTLALTLTLILALTLALALTLTLTLTPGELGLSRQPRVGSGRRRAALAGPRALRRALAILGALPPPCPCHIRGWRGTGSPRALRCTLAKFGARRTPTASLMRPAAQEAWPRHVISLLLCERRA